MTVKGTLDRLSAAVPLLAVAFTLHTPSAGLPRQTAPDSLRVEREAFIAAFNAQDTARLAALYAADAAFLPFTGQALTGGQPIAAGMARVAARVRIELQPLSSSRTGALASEAGTWRHVDRESGAAVDSGYLWVWRQDAKGAWVIAAHSVTRKAQPTDL